MENFNTERPGLVHTMMALGGVVPDHISTSTRCEKNSSKIKKNILCIVLFKGWVAREQIDPHPALEGALNYKFVGLVNCTVSFSNQSIKVTTP